MVRKVIYGACLPLILIGKGFGSLVMKFGELMEAAHEGLEMGLRNSFGGAIATVLISASLYGGYTLVDRTLTLEEEKAFSAVQLDAGRMQMEFQLEQMRMQFEGAVTDATLNAIWAYVRSITQCIENMDTGLRGLRRQ